MLKHLYYCCKVYILRCWDKVVIRHKVTIIFKMKMLNNVDSMYFPVCYPQFISRVARAANLMKDCEKSKNILIRITRRNNSLKFYSNRQCHTGGNPLDVT